MLHRANKLILLVLLPILVIGCLSEEEKLVRMRQSFAKEKGNLEQIRKDVFKYSIENIGKEDYWNIYEQVNDSIKLWLNNNLKTYAYENNNKWIVDSIICFSNDRRKCIMTLSVSDTLCKEAVSDGISYLCGVNINDCWYFFRGAAWVLPREYYQKDIHTPLSFETLKLLAAKHVFRGYLKKNTNRKYEINDKFFEGMGNKNMTGPGYGGCFECKTEEEYYLHLVKRNWSKKNID